MYVHVLAFMKCEDDLYISKDFAVIFFRNEVQPQQWMVENLREREIERERESIVTNQYYRT